MTQCSLCKKAPIVARSFCKKCYYALKYKGEISNLDKPIIELLTNIQQELLIGAMLGDGNLSRNKTSKFAHLKIERSSIDLEYLKFQYDIMKPLCKSSYKEYTRSDGKNNCYFISRSCEILDKLYCEWYPDNIKIVPSNLYLTNFVVSIWLADDGHISLHHKKQKLLRTTFATNGFTKLETEFLASKLTDKYKEKFSISKTSIEKQFTIIGAHYASATMIKEILPVFPVSMMRKFSNVPCELIN